MIEIYASVLGVALAVLASVVGWMIVTASRNERRIAVLEERSENLRERMGQIARIHERIDVLGTDVGEVKGRIASMDDRLRDITDHLLSGRSTGE